MKNFAIKFFSRLVMVAVINVFASVLMFGQVVSGNTYNTEAVSSLPTGWTGNDGGGTSYIKLIASSHYIQTSDFSQNGFTSIKVKARKFGGPSDAQALITVSWYTNGTETVLGTIAPTNTSLTDYTINSPTNPAGNTTGYVRIQCKGASSSKGSGVSQVTITYTAGSGGGSPAVGTTTTIDASGITNTDVYTGTAAGSLSASVTVTEGGAAVPSAAVTWSGNDNDVATINETTGVVTLVGVGTVTFTASYAGKSGEYEASSNTYEMTVTSSAPYVQPTEFDISLNDSLFGTNYGGTASGITDETPVSGSQDNVTVTYSGSGNHYINDSQIRFYPSNKLLFEAPSGYDIKSITFTSAGTWAATISADKGTYTSGTKTWSGTATSVLFTGSGTSRCDISKASIIIAEHSSAVETTITIDDTGITNTDVYLGTSAGSLSASVKDESDNIIGGAVVTWSGNNDAVATINSGTGEVTLISAGSVTFTASYAGVDDVYLESSSTYGLTVSDSTPFAGGDVTFVAGTDSGSTTVSSSPDEVSKAVVTISCTDAAFATAEYRFYKNSVTTVSTSQGVITKIIFTGISGNPASGFASQSGWTTDGNNGTWTGNSDKVTFTASGAQVRASQIVVTVNTGGCDVPTFSPASGTTFGNSGLDVTLSAEGGNEIYYTLDGTDPTTSSTEYTAPIHIDATTTVKAIAYDGANASSVVSATYTFVDPDRPGTKDNPYSVAQAFAAIDAGTGLTGVYAKGIVSEIVTAYNNTYHNISYNISTDGSTSGNQLQAYRGKSYSGANFTSADDIQVGDVVVIYGTLKKHNETYEFDADNQLVSLYRATVAPSETIDVDLTLSEGRYWATFYNATGRYTLPEGAQAFTVNTSKQLYLLGTTGSAIPANTAVVVIADKASITLTKSDSAAASENGGGNILQGSNEAVAVSGLAGTPYVLGVIGEVLGFYKYTGTEIPANKAYYVVND